MHATCIVWRGRERASRGRRSWPARAFGGAGPFFMWGRCESAIFVFAILLSEVPDASRSTGEHHRHAPHARGNRAMVASLGLAKINWVPCPAVGPMGVPIRGV